MESSRKRRNLQCQIPHDFGVDRAHGAGESGLGIHAHARSVGQSQPQSQPWHGCQRVEAQWDRAVTGAQHARRGRRFSRRMINSNLSVLRAFKSISSIACRTWTDGRHRFGRQHERRISAIATMSRRGESARAFRQSSRKSDEMMRAEGCGDNVS